VLTMSLENTGRRCMRGCEDNVQIVRREIRHKVLYWDILTQNGT
jgi:hypothetical protein